MALEEKDKKDFHGDVVPLSSRLCTALRRIALASESSSASRPHQLYAGYYDETALPPKIVVARAWLPAEGMAVV